MTARTILVTGGAGFIGFNFVRDLLAAEPETSVIVLDKLTYAGNPQSLAELAHEPRLRFVRADIADRATVRELLEHAGVTAIVHFAAESHVDRSIDGPAAFIHTNVVGTFELLDEVRAYLAAHPARREQLRFLHVSTDEVFGALGADGMFTEQTAYAPRSPYAASKAASDHLVGAYFHTYGVPVVTTNCSNNYGPYQFPEKLIPLVIANGLAGEPLPVYGAGQNVRDWIHVLRSLRRVARGPRSRRARRDLLDRRAQRAQEPRRRAHHLRCARRHRAARGRLVASRADPLRHRSPRPRLPLRDRSRARRARARLAAADDVRGRHPRDRRLVHRASRVDGRDPQRRLSRGRVVTAARRASMLGLLLVIVAVAVIRAPAVNVDILNEDEALYATTAASMAEGAPIYRAGVESKPPGIFYIYEAAFAVVGRYAMKALHALTILWVLGTALLVGALARRAVPRVVDATGPPRVVTPAVIASLLYAGFVIVQEPAVLATQCELLFSLPLALAAWLVVRACSGAWRTYAWLALIAAGFLCGAGTLIKPTAVSLPVAATAWLVLRRAFLRGPDRWVLDLARAACVWLGFACAWLAAYAYFSSLGVWDDLVYWAFRWTLGLYIPTGTSHSPWLVRFFAGFVVWAVLISILWILAVVAVRGSAKARLAETARYDAPDAPLQVVWLLALWTAAATALTFLGGRFFDHYFPAVIPPLAALATVGLVAVRGSARWRRAIWVMSVAPILACWLGTWQFSTTMRWLGDQRRPYDEIADYTRAHTAETDRVFVWGYYPLIYVAADRLAATRFVGCHYLTGYAAIGLGQDLPAAVEDRLGVPNGFHTLLADLEQTRPTLLIDTSPGDLHHWRRYPLSRYPSLSAYVAAHYRLETTIQGADIYRRTPDHP